jgi:hypothetical protein
MDDFDSAEWLPFFPEAAVSFCAQSLVDEWKQANAERPADYQTREEWKTSWQLASTRRQPSGFDRAQAIRDRIEHAREALLQDLVSRLKSRELDSAGIRNDPDGRIHPREKIDSSLWELYRRRRRDRGHALEFGLPDKPKMTMASVFVRPARPLPTTAFSEPPQAGKPPAPVTATPKVVLKHAGPKALLEVAQAVYRDYAALTIPKAEKLIRAALGARNLRAGKQELRDLMNKDEFAGQRRKRGKPTAS